MKLDDTRLSMPPQQVSLDVLEEKYAKGDERTVDDVRRRVAKALAAVEKEPARWEPVFFEALQFDGQEFGQGDFYSDGGILINYPLQIFDERPFAWRNRWFVNGVNWETLGCRMYTPDDCPKRSGQITNLLTYIQNVMEAVIETQAATYQLSKSAPRRTVDISDCCVRSTDWDVRPDPQDERYRRLVRAGEMAALHYLDDYKPPVIKPLLPFSWYLDRWWRSFTKPLNSHD